MHIPVPDPETGTEVEVTIVQRAAEDVTDERTTATLKLLDLFGLGRGLFASPEEADAYIREGRGPWPT